MTAHCVVCVNTGDMTTPATTTVYDYHVCDEHTWIDQYPTLQDALIAHDQREAQRKAT